MRIGFQVEDIRDRAEAAQGQIRWLRPEYQA